MFQIRQEETKLADYRKEILPSFQEGLGLMLCAEGSEAVRCVLPVQDLNALRTLYTVLYGRVPSPPAGEKTVLYGGELDRISTELETNPHFFTVEGRGEEEMWKLIQRCRAAVDHSRIGDSKPAPVMDKQVRAFLDGAFAPLPEPPMGMISVRLLLMVRHGLRLRGRDLSPRILRKMVEVVNNLTFEKGYTVDTMSESASQVWREFGSLEDILIVGGNNCPYVEDSHNHFDEAELLKLRTLYTILYPGKPLTVKEGSRCKHPEQLVALKEIRQDDPLHTTLEGYPEDVDALIAACITIALNHGHM